MTNDSLIAFLKELVNSDICMREEDEGNVSPLMEKARTLISQYDNGLEEKQGENTPFRAHGVSSEIRLLNEDEFVSLWGNSTWARSTFKFLEREGLGVTKAMKPVMSVSHECTYIGSKCCAVCLRSKSIWRRLKEWLTTKI